MNLNVWNIFGEWKDTTIGSTVRGQRVEGVSMEMEDDGPDIAVWLHVHLAEIVLPQNMAPEKKMLHRVFDDRGFATTRKLTPDEAMEIMRGEKEAEWFLPDEAKR